MTNTLSTIAQLNDAFRQSLQSGKVMLTYGITTLPEPVQQAILQTIRTFQDFNPDNDPYQEHDFGAFDYQNHRIFWKIDYYDPEMTFASENPADPNCTIRVLTIMLAEEY